MVRLMDSAGKSRRKSTPLRLIQSRHVWLVLGDLGTKALEFNVAKYMRDALPHTT